MHAGHDAEVMSGRSPAELEAEAKAQAEATAKAKVQAEVEAKLRAKAKAGAGAEAKVQAEAKGEAEAEAKAKANLLAQFLFSEQSAKPPATIGETYQQVAALVEQRLVQIDRGNLPQLNSSYKNAVRRRIVLSDVVSSTADLADKLRKVPSSLLPPVQSSTNLTQLERAVKSAESAVKRPLSALQAPS